MSAKRNQSKNARRAKQAKRERPEKRRVRQIGPGRWEIGWITYRRSGSCWIGKIAYYEGG